MTSDQAQARASIIGWLRSAPAGALFATEISTRLDANPRTSGMLEAALEALNEQHEVVVVDHPAPDAHLRDFDRRTVALATSGTIAAHDVWNDWLRAFLSTHRCC